MSVIKVKVSGFEFNADLTKSVVGSDTAKRVETTLIVSKNELTTKLFSGWRKDQGITFEFDDDGFQDLFLIEESPNHFIFMNA
ncbi:hypothetical protein ACMGEE_01320 [Erwinia sp. DT-104]|uniref:hypothetical protein n=1 Tax=Erwinia sp. DT-104 TaxID=3396161 RepID=UPI003F1DBE06